MITYFYWAIIASVVMAALIIIGGKLQKWKIALLVALGVLVVGYGAYYFHFQQIFVKRYGGIMTIKVPDGELHLVATWKDDNLWIESYDPVTNTCHFREYSRGNLLQGQVTLKNCNPLLRQATQ